MARATARASRRVCAGSLAVLSLAAVPIGCGSAGGGGTRTSGASTGPASAIPASAPSVAQGPVGSVERGQLAHFALLRGRPERLPAAVRDVWRPPISGLNWKRAQRLPLLVPGAYWLVPGSRYLCIVSEVPATPGVGSICTPSAIAFRHAIASISIARAGRGFRRLIIGVAPDGTRQVVFHTQGAVATAPVADGLFVLRDAAARPSDSVTLR
jgi:hypothetical protein